MNVIVGLLDRHGHRVEEAPRVKLGPQPGGAAPAIANVVPLHRFASDPLFLAEPPHVVFDLIWKSNGRVSTTSTVSSTR